jgi:protein involved in polysaccharide export with SLBB domain
MWIATVITVSLSLMLASGLLGQSKSENAKTLRAWSLKSGPGAPHNIKPSGEVGQRDFVAPFLRMPKLSSEYVLGDGDSLDIKIVGGGALNDSLQSLTISNSGEISIPHLGSIQAAGLTSAELEEKIVSLFVEKKLLKSPEVLAYITDYKAKPFFITGEVDNPGEYIMSQELTLMEGILMAGGIDPGADSFAYLHRRKSSKEAPVEPAHAVQNPEVGAVGVEVTKIDLRPLKKGGVPKPDILLQKGDVLVIPKSKDMRFYVVGDVRSPGFLEIPPPAERRLLVSQAIAKAGGPGRTAKMSKGILVRYNEPDGSREERKVDFAAILKGKQPDFEIRPNDIIFIPGSNAKALGYGLLGVVPMGVQQKGVERMEEVKSDSN